ncbi:hypothetical protein Taro_032045 [Colocasia esculenta]|uniref:Uncharacterized protein n=1 Tax=Colocasia esculenta TaxID=4460 RepID=A0A843VKC7_COLES|nr:hypothetical protein [Colocasia esculenta]
MSCVAAAGGAARRSGGACAMEPRRFRPGPWSWDAARSGGEAEARMDQVAEVSWRRLALGRVRLVLCVAKRMGARQEGDGGAARARRTWCDARAGRMACAAARRVRLVVQSNRGRDGAVRAVKAC